MTPLEDVVYEAVSEAAREFDHPQAVDPVGDAVRTILSAVAAQDAPETSAPSAGHVHVDVVRRIALAYLERLASGYAVAIEVNDVLGGHDDPIGVAAWWTQTDGRLRDGRAPRDLLGTGSQGREVLRALAAGTVDVGG